MEDSVLTSRALCRGLAVVLAIGFALLSPLAGRAEQAPASPISAAEGDTLRQVRERGYLTCGVNARLTGLGSVDPDGVWRGFDIDYCRAVAAAALGDSGRVRFVPLDIRSRLLALTSGEVDLLSRNTTWTLERDAGQGISFVGVSLFDGPGLLAWKDLPGDDLASLPPTARLCVQSAATAARVLPARMAAAGLSFTILPFRSLEEARMALFTRACDGYVADRTALASLATFEAPRPDALRLLPDLLAVEPLGPAVRDGDANWFDIARWTLFALIKAEEEGLSHDRLPAVLESTQDPELRRFLGLDPGVGAPLGLDDAWVRRIVSQVGTYGEVFDRNLGQGSPLKLERGPNALRRDGGLMVAPPFF
ncbi:amino acid ABC transporter substrate-binding protein [Rhodospirillum rubrum]|uniref:Extracellular solute-binding protein, family 3 n=1 Tax=Rhodospirillum rubrum (strain ATCC 11170 / ATH 1.1.1 / DSM 467 / LMG 4362 / NCIMB 8255 / S1) TaxID=269796 RepID=Q2RXA1_RHORT|nr:amino acid ABC transporter substrate-binding protein [Rhodospirillum rubrum]ABC21244.1 extracellular solute-binding protein, family 3 [Rhodospirillum rubrum ATCC 11170]AEO46919.1 extracellular solute-binding protein [Rhodospirillum rubrum F11]MBK5952797.1 amino acid ABC transporter substrate-binding protein [Rhodospirillum rubrum]QXG80929.1 amino acid ABC transporter substrate-binding protein [Rhodospirillum rubrum]HAP99765.1 amino acid ABC transporter substrate-binding protein [Rhodospiril